MDVSSCLLSWHSIKSDSTHTHTHTLTVSLVIFCINSESGEPTIWSILVSWSIWSVPGNNTCPVSSSAMIQPTDHMSTEDIQWY